MIDAHFVKFTHWLGVNAFDDAIAVVEKTLIDQGRTVELKNMRDRIARAVSH
jgi:hypothetical protein